MNNIETMKLALEALELAKRSHGKFLLSDPPQEAWKTYRVDDSITKAVTALRQAINAAEQREQAQQAEPWEKFCDSNCVWTDHHPDCKLAERLPLTDEEIENIANSNLCVYSFARAIEAAHGIKGEA